MRARKLLTLTSAAVAVATVTASTPSSGSAVHRPTGPSVIAGYRHLVVIYEENHSFDNLYGTWGRVGRGHVTGLRSADQLHTTQVAQNGDAYGCLLQDDVKLTSPPLATTCVDTAHGVTASHFANSPFAIDDYVRPTDATCPPAGTSAPNGLAKGEGEPGGCTRDLVHRFYQEQYQLNGGLQNRYATGSDAVGLTMGQYDTRRLPIYRYLHGRHAPKYVIADRFFQAAFGGSFLNHQWLVAARSPLDTSGGADTAQHSVLDAAGFPNSAYPLYHPTTPVVDGQLTQACGASAVPDRACGDYAVNTMQPANTPHGSGPQLPLIDDSKYPNIGDELSSKGVSWNWYSGGWNDAEAGHPGPLFQFHHQPLNYFANYAPGQPGRAHLRDETEFVTAARRGTLPTVSFVKPYGSENEHPGYASEPNGSDHLVDLLRTILHGPQARSTLVVVTYDEFGGQWDHVPPPGQGNTTPGVSDEWGPGTRIPALIVSASLRRSGVDHTVYDTTSILATIERGLGLAPMSSRDRAVADLRNAIRVGCGRGR
jgi:phospholipase C